MEAVNQNSSLGEEILISLSPKYNNIATIIKETKDLSALSIHNLMGSLEMHEQKLGRYTEQSIESAFQFMLH